MSSKTIGTTTISATSGSAAGIAIATLIAELVPGRLDEAGMGALALVCSLLLGYLGYLGYLGGFLAPSKKAEAQAYTANLLDEDVDATAPEYAQDSSTASSNDYTPAHTRTGNGATATATAADDRVTEPDYIA